MTSELSKALDGLEADFIAESRTHPDGPPPWPSAYHTIRRDEMNLLLALAREAVAARASAACTCAGGAACPHLDPYRAARATTDSLIQKGGSQ